MAGCHGGCFAYVCMPGSLPQRITCEDGFTVQDACDACGIEDYFAISGGRVVNVEDVLDPGTFYTLRPRLRGGKGGFGSMLRAIGAQIEKTTNREACRDLSGRRMRDVNNEKKMIEYLEKKAERERERDKKKKEKLERLTRAPKHFFNDPEYESKLHEVVENVDKALEKGLKSHSKKRKVQPQNDAKEGPELKKGLWLGMQDDTDSDSDSDDEMSLATLRTSPQALESHNSDAGPSCSKEEVQGMNFSDVTKGYSACISEAYSTAVQDGSEGPSVGNTDETSAQANDETRTTEISNTEENGVGKIKSKITEKDEATGSDAGGSRVEGTQERTEQKPTADGDDQEHKVQLQPDDLPSADDLAASQENKKSTDPTPGQTNAHSVECVNGGLEVIKQDSAEMKDVDLTSCNTIEDFEDLGLEALKFALMKRGVKCGGTLKERAVRMYNIKDLSPDQINPSLLANNKNKKRRNRSKK